MAAGLALMVLSGGLVWVARLGDPRASLPPAVAQVDRQSNTTSRPSRSRAWRFADANYDQAVADLEKALEAGRSRLDPETVRILEDNLRTIDQAIEQSRKALRADPANVYLNNHFAASRNRKLALLRRASALAMAQRFRPEAARKMIRQAARVAGAIAARCARRPGRLGAGARAAHAADRPDGHRGEGHAA